MVEASNATFLETALTEALSQHVAKLFHVLLADTTRSSDARARFTAGLEKALETYNAVRAQLGLADDTA